MNIKRFTAPTSREALAKARMAFGEGTSSCPTGPPPTAWKWWQPLKTPCLRWTARPKARAAPHHWGGRDFQDSRPHDDDRLGGKNNHRAAPRATQMAAPPAATTGGRDEQLAMSTLSFQDYVRERMLRRRHEAMNGPPRRPPLPSAAATRTATSRERPAAPAVVRHNPALHSHGPASEPAPRRKAEAAAAISMAQQQSLMNELHAMKEMIEDRFNTMGWLGRPSKPHPVQPDAEDDSRRLLARPGARRAGSVCPKTCPPVTPCAG